MYFLDQKSLQATVVKLYWQIKAQTNLKKKWAMSILNLLYYSLFYIGLKCQ